jgi:ATP-dependent DNA helicase RecG
VDTRQAQTAQLFGPIGSIKYTGGKRGEALAALGITCIDDLLTYYPRRYNDFSKIVPIAQARIGERASVLVIIDNVRTKRVARNKVVVEADTYDSSGVLSASWFAQPWMQRNLQQGMRVVLLGKVGFFNGFKTMSSPEYTVLNKDATERLFNPDAAPGAGQGKDAPQSLPILPVYAATAQISTAWIARIVREAFSVVPATLDFLPAQMRSRLRLMGRAAALHEMHLPSDDANLKAARRRLAFEEVLLLQLWMMMATTDIKGTVPLMSALGTAPDTMDKTDTKGTVPLVSVQKEPSL